MRITMPDPLFMSKFAAMNATRCQRWHGPAGVMSWSPERWGCTAAGEMGETCNVLKKIWREEDGHQSKAVTETSEELLKKAACTEIRTQSRRLHP